MRIFHEASGREAKPVKGRDDPVAVYKCFPAGGKKNLDSLAVKFVDISDAVSWLKRTSGGGIRVAQIKPEKGKRTAIINSGLIAKHSDGRVERL